MVDRRAKKKSAKFRLKLEVDLSNWGTGEWPYDLQKTMKVEIDNGTVVFEVNEELWEQAALKIAKEAVESFFDEGMHVHLTKDGVQLTTDDGHDILVPFSEIWCDIGRQDRDALVRALNANPYDNDDNYELFMMGDLVSMATADPGAMEAIEPWGAPTLPREGR